MGEELREGDGRGGWREEATWTARAAEEQAALAGRHKAHEARNGGDDTAAATRIASLRRALRSHLSTAARARRAREEGPAAPAGVETGGGRARRGGVLMERVREGGAIEDTGRKGAPRLRRRRAVVRKAGGTERAGR